MSVSDCSTSRLAGPARLNAARWPEVKAAAAKILPLPQGQNAQSFPPLAELLKLKGDAAAGEKVFLREQNPASNKIQLVAAYGSFQI